MAEPTKQPPPTNGDAEPEITQGSSKIPLFIKSGWSFIVEVGKVVIISLVIITVVKQFLFQPFYVKGASMEPTFFDREYLIINEISYRFREPQRGDIVVLKYPRDPSQYFIKRIVGLPNERVDVKNGGVMISNADSPDGFTLNESLYLNSAVRTTGTGPVQLGTHEYFVMGDNRASSLDSRSSSLGPIDRSAIVGRAWFRLWPPQRFTIFESPDYDSTGSDQ
ncbi:MAG: signal peptidase I [Candidatus Kerfeldbacteria bacterium]|nr:signal peptidase I [Candidatus Kerfeldbacteria bacterium]